MTGNKLFSVCDVCGCRDNITKGITHHTFGGFAGYGSAYDGEYISLVLCSECLDKIIRARQDESTEQHSQR